LERWTFGKQGISVARGGSANDFRNGGATPADLQRLEMRVSYYLSSLPALISIIPTAVAMGAQILIRGWVGVDKLARNNGNRRIQVCDRRRHLCGAAGLLGHRRLGEIQQPQDAVAEEAGATAALFHYAEGDKPEAHAVPIAITNYLKAAIDKEWPAMARESESRDVTHALSRFRLVNNE
jgi:hypothetical protein